MAAVNGLLMPITRAIFTAREPAANSAGVGALGCTLTGCTSSPCSSAVVFWVVWATKALPDKNVSANCSIATGAANNSTITRYVVIRLVDVLRNITEQNSATVAVVTQQS